jgi:large subunit ribosomal protein L19e
MGKREGTISARISYKVLWMRRIRILRRLLKKYREMKKIDKHIYHSFYLKCKGNQFKNKYVLIEAIHKAKSEEKRAKDAGVQAEAKKAKKNVVEKKDIKAVPAAAPAQAK